jgi:4-hydroxybenzoate polyprenyltransferase
VALALWYYPMLRTRDRMKCFFVFRHNNWLGACVFAGVAVAYALR